MDGISYCGIQWLNVVSSIAFLIAAGALCKNKSKILVLLLALTGIGSFLWHLVGGITFFFDAIPIALFLIGYAYLLLRKKQWALVLAALLLIVSVLRPLDSLLFGAQPYVIALIFIGIHLIDKNIRKRLMLPFILLAGAIMFRQIDPFVCAFFPPGTHFIWHILVAAAAYYAVKNLSALNRTGGHF